MRLIDADALKEMLTNEKEHWKRRLKKAKEAEKERSEWMDWKYTIKLFRDNANDCKYLIDFLDNAPTIVPSITPTEGIEECGYCPTKRDGVLTIVSNDGDKK